MSDGRKQWMAAELQISLKRQQSKLCAWQNMYIYCALHILCTILGLRISNQILRILFLEREHLKTITSNIFFDLFTKFTEFKIIKISENILIFNAAVSETNEAL